MARWATCLRQNTPSEPCNRSPNPLHQRKTNSPTGSRSVGTSQVQSVSSRSDTVMGAEDADEIRRPAETAGPANLGNVVTRIGQHLFGGGEAFARDPGGEREPAFAVKMAGEMVGRAAEFARESRHGEGDVRKMSAD